MSRASRRDNSTSMSLFPFLAVLLCTMGVLVVLLVVMASVQLTQAETKQQAEATQDDTAYQSSEQQVLRSKLAAIEQQQAQLEAIRDEANVRLRREEQRLSQVEENIRRRQERLVLLRAEIEELQALSGEGADNVQQARERLQLQQRLIAELKGNVEQLRERDRKQETHFAIIPYNGAEGTRRRPIYIECRHDSIVIQPENIVLTPADFNRVAPAGAPLPAAIRAAQRYYIDRGLADNEQPYPLVLIRPDASTSFLHVARMLEDTQAMYGYELVAADWTFDYSAANPQLSDEMQRAVNDARRMLEALRTAAPGTFAANSVHDFEPGPSLLELVRSGKLVVDHSSSGRGRAGGQKRQAVVADGPVDFQRLASVMQDAMSASTSENGEQPPQDDRWRMGAAGANISPSRSSTSAFAGGSRPSSNSPEQATTQQDDSMATAQVPATDAEGSGEKATSSDVLNASLASTESRATPESADTPAASASPMQAMATAPSDTSHGSAAGNAGAAAMGSTMPDSLSEGYSPSPNKKATPQGTAIVRTIRVHVGSQQLQVGSITSGTLIPLDESSNRSGKDAAIRFIKAIQSEVRNWGIAGDGLYWKAVLQMTVSPGGEQIAQNLAETLRDSGIEVEVEHIANNHLPTKK